MKMNGDGLLPVASALTVIAGAYLVLRILLNKKYADLIYSWTAEKNGIDNALPLSLWARADKIKSNVIDPMRAKGFRITSIFRSPELQKKINPAVKDSDHAHLLAFDVGADGGSKEANETDAAYLGRLQATLRRLEKVDVPKGFWRFLLEGDHVHVSIDEAKLDAGEGVTA